MIARTVHAPEMKRRIAERLEHHSQAVSSLVVKQEYKRRLLKEARYLLDLLNEKGSFQRVRRHVTGVLPRQMERKRNICLDILDTIFEEASDTELTERARRYLRTLLRCGLNDFDNTVDYVLWQSGCACANYPVVEKVRYKRYEFGPERCEEVATRCGVSAFMEDHGQEIKRIIDYLEAIPANKKSDEIKKAEEFIRAILKDSTDINALNPCLTVGDLLIALESFGLDYFYTLNGKESQYLCRALKQSLIVRPKNPDRDDRLCLNTNADWPEF
jgi:hypothetical protein